MNGSSHEKTTEKDLEREGVGKSVDQTRAQDKVSLVEGKEAASWWNPQSSFQCAVEHRAQVYANCEVDSL